MLTRRLFAGALSGAALLPFIGAASAQRADTAALLQPGPLPEMVLGKADAPVTIVEYSSLTCSHCADFHEKVLPQLKAKYIDTGKVRLIMREFPLDQIAYAASTLARCVPQDRGFAFVEALFATQKGWAFTQNPQASLLAFAKQAGFTQESFEACLKNQPIRAGVLAVRARGHEAFGVDSTPTFFINGERQVGALSVEEFSKILDALIR